MILFLKEATDDLSESQPTAGNIAGGLTTIEEKAFGIFKKLDNVKFIDVSRASRRTKKRSRSIFYGHIISSRRMFNSSSSSRI